MKWPTWEQGVVLAVTAGVVALVAGRGDTPARRRVADASQEVAIIAVLYALWRFARKLPFASTEGAIERGQWIDDAQRFLHVPSELSLQHFVLDHESLARFLNAYYAVVHVPSIIAFLVWMYVRHRDAYPHWRNVLAITTGACLVIRFLRVAPPRLVPGLGYVDLSSIYGMSVYGPVGTGVSDQFAAMPSIHVAWAAVIAFGAVSASSSPWRWLVFAHLPVTMIAVSATGHHWWLDGVVAVGIVAAAMWVDGRADTMLRIRRRETGACLTTT